MVKFFKKIKRFFNNRVLICDLDGTLIETKSGSTFPKDGDDWKFRPLIQAAIQEYNPRYIFIVTNQGGIEKGYVDKKDFIAKLQRIMKIMRTWGDYIVDGTYCESNDSKNYWRKPNIGMIDFFRHGYIQGYDFDNRNALMIGDASGLSGQFSDTDLQTARNAGIRYADVEHFVEAMCPCYICSKIDSPCMAGEGKPFLPCDDSSIRRLKRTLLN